MVPDQLALQFPLVSTSMMAVAVVVIVPAMAASAVLRVAVLAVWSM